MTIELSEKERQLLVIALEIIEEEGYDLIKKNPDDEKELRESIQEYKELREKFGIY